MSLKKPAILIAEDEPDLLYLFEQGLEMIGAEVLSAPDGLQAWNIFQERNGKIDLVISDIFMPGINGVQLMTKVKTSAPEVPVFLITGYAHLHTLVEESSFEPDAYLEKPFNLPDLFKLIKKVIPTSLNIPDL